MKPPSPPNFVGTHAATFTLPVKARPPSHRRGLIYYPFSFPLPTLLSLSFPPCNSLSVFITLSFSLTLFPLPSAPHYPIILYCCIFLPRFPSIFMPRISLFPSSIKATSLHSLSRLHFLLVSHHLFLSLPSLLIFPSLFFFAQLNLPVF